MSHDDPSTKDATNGLPDCGGSSFLRTGSSPSFARMRARWTAFSLAAAVLLGGSRALADGGVLVHIDSPVPATLAEAATRGHVGRRVMLLSDTHPVCDTPCDRRIYGDQGYVITGRFPESPTFRLSNLTGDVTITVQPGSYGRRNAGVGAVLGGGLGVVPGVLMVTFGSLLGQNAVKEAGIGVVVAGGVAAIVGAVLLATSGTKVRLQQPGAGPVGRAAPFKPRYWMGEF